MFPKKYSFCIKNIYYYFKTYFFFNCLMYVNMHNMGFLLRKNLFQLDEKRENKRGVQNNSIIFTSPLDA